jgi:hypothetical protein
LPHFFPVFPSPFRPLSNPFQATVQFQADNTHFVDIGVGLLGVRAGMVKDVWEYAWSRLGIMEGFWKRQRFKGIEMLEGGYCLEGISADRPP